MRAPAKRFSTRKSTSKASWGAAQQRDFQQENPQAKASWGAGPQQRDFQQENPQAKAGWGKINFGKYYFFPTPF